MKNTLFILGILLFISSISGKASNRFSYMPAVIINFQGIQNGNDVDLTWQTASETNNDYFTIERSTDSINFFPIGNVLGAGNSGSTLNYSYTDTTVSVAQKYFYRLKMTDFSGSTTYSEIISINYITGINETKKKGSEIKVYPNPANENIRIEIAKGVVIKNIKLHDLNGKLIKTFPSTNTLLNIADISQGKYLLLITTEKGTFTEKIIIQ